MLNPEGDGNKKLHRFKALRRDGLGNAYERVGVTFRGGEKVEARKEEEKCASAMSPVIVVDHVKSTRGKRSGR